MSDLHDEMRMWRKHLRECREADEALSVSEGE